LRTSTSEFVQKCGLDAYFFLRYLRTLLKIFVPATLVILPILLPLNKIGGKGTSKPSGNPDAKANNVTGLDQLAWGNVDTSQTSRYWAHWLLALMLICYVCFIAFDELRGYIRMRQAYLTSPQHRLRASATTVLVSSIPRKWCTVEQLDGLYDVFPGGIRNIWLNRNFDELSEKIQRRDQLAQTLESAETDLIKKCWKANEKKTESENKEAGKKLSKEEKSRIAAAKDEKGALNAKGHGLSSGNPHQVQHTVQEAVDGTYDSNSESESVHEDAHRKTTVPIPILGEGIHAVTQGLGKIGKGVFGGLKRVDKGINKTIDTTNGFLPPEQDPAQLNSDGSQNASHEADHRSTTVETQGRGRTRGTSQTFQSPNSLSGTDGQWDHGGHSSHHDDDRRPLGEPSPTTPNKPALPEPEKEKPKGALHAIKSVLGLAKDDAEPIEYPPAFNEEFDIDPEDAVWRRYIKEKDRDTMRLPIFGWQWMFALPLIGKKVDTIYYCRKEVARLNLEIEEDQSHPDRFPLLNSAFIQFNHQVAAHMACQSVSHHVPKQMAPRLVEIDPKDVVWENMSIPWWQSYIRTAAIISLVAAMIVLWAIPVAFTSALSQISTLAQTVKWLNFLLKLPTWFISALQGVLPAAFLAILMFVLPMILRFLSKLQGTQSGMLIELSVQKYYFFFLFVQIFLVVSVAAAVSTLLGLFTGGAAAFTNIPKILATNVPRASNYFFSYMLLQALSVSAGALVQVGGLISWFILAPIFDSTARSKFKRQTQLPEIQWGTFFPVYTNLACIGLIYSVISPLILIFNVITFSLFWFVNRYNTLYVTKFARDTGGLLFPVAINYTFVGVYVMELVLIGLFFLVRDDQNNAACYGQGVGMVVILILTAIYQILLNEAFSPLFRYLPITLEDDAVRRDEEFARALNQKSGLIEDELEGEDLQDELERRERESREEDRQAEQYELKQLEAQKQRKVQTELEPYEYQNPEVSMHLDKESKTRHLLTKTGRAANAAIHKLPVPTTTEHRGSWADRSRNRRSSVFGQSVSPAGIRSQTSDSFSTHSRHHHTGDHRTRNKSPTRKALDVVNNLNPLLGNEKDMEAQKAARNQLAEALFAGLNDELEDLTPDQRDVLVQRAFQHSAMRARRPAIWLPRDELGVSDYEVRRMAEFSSHIWSSNVRQGLDSKGRCVYSGAPPDFSEVDLIEL
jgi:calcium permeable stress-gated cation channel